jgi:hypothetical protein
MRYLADSWQAISINNDIAERQMFLHSDDKEEEKG